VFFFGHIFFFVFQSFVTKIFASLFSSQNRSSCLSRSTSTGGRSSSSRYLLLSLPELYHHYHRRRRLRVGPFFSLAFFFFQRALKVLFRSHNKSAHGTCRSSLSLSLSLYTLGTKLQAETSRHRGAKGKHHRREERGENAEK
jgi:hypothetical protein